MFSTPFFEGKRLVQRLLQHEISMPDFDRFLSYLLMITHESKCEEPFGKITKAMPVLVFHQTNSQLDDLRHSMPLLAVVRSWKSSPRYLSTWPRWGGGQNGLVRSIKQCLF